MGISLIDALTIATRDDDVKCEIYGHTKTEPRKWAGAIMLYNGNDVHRPIITSNAVFESEEECLEAMRKIVTSTRKDYADGKILWTTCLRERQ